MRRGLRDRTTVQPDTVCVPQRDVLEQCHACIGYLSTRQRRLCFDVHVIRVRFQLPHAAGVPRYVRGASQLVWTRSDSHI